MKKYIARFVSVFVFSAAWMAVACAQDGQEPKDGSSDKVLARVGQAAITQGQFREVINSVPPQSKRELLLQKDQVLEEMVNQELLVQEGEILKLAQDPLVLKALERAKRQLIVQRVLQLQVREKVKVTPEEVKEYYEKNVEKFQVPEKVRAAHILVKEEKLARELAEKIKKGSDFAALAAQHSLDPSKLNGGDLGFFERGRMVGEFEKAAFALKDQEVSGVVQTKFGFHLIKVLEHSPARPMEFGEVKDRLAQELLTKNQQQAFAKLLEDLKKKIPVQTYPELLGEVQ